LLGLPFGYICGLLSSEKVILISEFASAFSIAVFRSAGKIKK